MIYSTDKHLDKALREVVSKGATIQRTRKNHLRIRLPDGSLVFASSTPSDNRGTKNLLALIRRLSV